MKIAYYLPEKILDNEQLEKEFPEWSASKISEKVGIDIRHIAAENETALDMAYESAVKVLGGIDRDTIDFLLLCTQSPDYFLPTSACILQEKLGLRTDIGAFDYNLGCSGFVYGLGIAKGLLKTGIAHNILLIMSETYSKHMHPNDRSNRSIFGDGSAATLLTTSDADSIYEFVLGTDGKGKDNLITRTGAFRQREAVSSDKFTDDEGNFYNPACLFMNGPEIFNFTIENVPPLVNAVLLKNKLSMEDIDYVIFHQANKYMLEYLRKKLKIPPEKYYLNMLNTGNTVSATIPIALKDCLDNNIVKKGDKVMLVGFGVGYSWGATVIEI